MLSGKIFTYEITVGWGVVDTIETLKAGQDHGVENDWVIASQEMVCHLRVVEEKEVARILAEGTTYVKTLGWEQSAYQDMHNKVIGCRE